MVMDILQALLKKEDNRAPFVETELVTYLRLPGVTAHEEQSHANFFPIQDSLLG